METRLTATQVSNKTAVTRNIASHPLRIVTPDNHGHAAWAFQSSYGGGFVGEDEVSLTVEVEDGATLYLSSQASTKVYANTQAKSTVKAIIKPNGTLISWPDPIVCFAKAQLTQHQTYALESSANLICVEAWTSGRAANGERWQFEKLSTRLQVTIAGERKLSDALRLTGEDGALPTRMASMNAFATVVLAGPKTKDHAKHLHEKVTAQPVNTQPLTISSTWPWGTVLRIAAPTTDSLHATLKDFLQQHVADLLGDDPLARKW